MIRIPVQINVKRMVMEKGEGETPSVLIEGNIGNKVTGSNPISCRTSMSPELARLLDAHLETLLEDHVFESVNGSICGDHLRLAVDNALPNEEDTRA